MKVAYLIFALLITNLLSAQNPVNKVLIIGIDGCRQDALRAANTPNIDALLTNAVYSFDALTHYPTWSGAGWSSMLTGVWETKHGVYDNSFVGANFGAYPHFIARIETVQPALNTASISHWAPINNTINTLCDYELNVGTDALVASNAVSYLTNNNPDVLFLQFDDVDHAGHQYGFSPTVPQYIDVIETTDGYVGQIMTALHNRPDYANENWLVIVVPDHGGNPAGHGGASFEERNIFIIAHNDGFTATEITRDSSVFSPAAALSYDGATHYTSPINSAPFQFGTVQDFSVELRIKPGALTGDAAFIGTKDWDSGAYPGWVISTPTNDLTRWKVNIGDGSNRADLTGGQIDGNKWTHLSVTFARDGNMILYENGNKVGEVSLSAVGNVNTPYDLVMGQDGTLGYPYWYEGLISEVRIWNRVLTEEEIVAHACSGVDSTHTAFANLIAYWPMDEGTGNVFHNVVDPNNSLIHHGNAPTWTPNPGGLVCYDFDNTPRIVDVAVSSLAHLCVPIDSAWALDGHSLVNEPCAIVGTPQPSPIRHINIYPNPTEGQVTVFVPHQRQPGNSIQLIGVLGNVLNRWEIQSEETVLSLKGVSPGFYWLSIQTDAGTEVRPLVVK